MTDAPWNELTLITTCKGRLHHLERSLPLFLAQVFEREVVYRLVVVDYGCPDEAFDWCRTNVDDPRLTLVHVRDDVEHFNLSRARNIGGRLGGGGVLAFFDADILLPEDALARGLDEMRSRDLDRLNHSHLRHEDGRPCLNGQVLITAKAFHALRGYDEVMCCWGGDDIDLYDRSRLQGQTFDVWDSGFRTIHHEDDERLQYVGATTKEESLEHNHAVRDARRDGVVNPSGYGRSADHELWPETVDDPLHEGNGVQESLATGCVCTESGWCERHQCTKTSHWHELCRSRGDYRRLWDLGRGPGQRLGRPARRAVARNEYYESIDTWSPIEDVYRRGLATARDGDLFVEVGVWKGRSVCFLGEAARRQGRSIRIVAVDHFDPQRAPRNEPDYGRQFRSNVRHQGLADVVDVRVSDSTDAAGTVPKESAHMVFVDAAHDYDSVRDDLRAWYSRVRPGGLLAGHDWSFPAVRRAVEEFTAEQGLSITFSSDRQPCWMIERPRRQRDVGPLLAPRYFAPVFQPLRGRRWGYVAMPGNVGDALIRRATLRFLRRFEVEFLETDPSESENVDGWLVAGGGNMGARYRRCQDLRQRLLADGRPVVVLPQSFTTVEHLPYERVWVRERTSLRFSPDARLAPDLALGLPRRVAGEPDLGEGLWLRTDGEASFADVPSNGDPASLCGNPREYLELAARHEHVVTDRLHFAIAALLGGRRATLLPNAYHKNRAMYETWLAELGCGWRDTP